LDNGVKVIGRPPFVGQDEDIIVNTETNGIFRTRLSFDVNATYSSLQLQSPGECRGSFAFGKKAA